MAGGLKAGELQAGRLGGATPPPAVLSACVRDLIWIPAGIVQAHGARAALAHSRATLFRDAAVRV